MFANTARLPTATIPRRNPDSARHSRSTQLPAAAAAAPPPPPPRPAVGAIPLDLCTVVGQGGGFVCANCGQSFQHRGALRTHEKSCRSRSFPCVECSRAGHPRTFRTLAAMHGHKSKCQFQKQAGSKSSTSGGRLELEVKRLRPWNPNSGPRDLCLGPIEQRRSGSAATMSKVSTATIQCSMCPTDMAVPHPPPDHRKSQEPACMECCSSQRTQRTQRTQRSRVVIEISRKVVPILALLAHRSATRVHAAMPFPPQRLA